MVLASFLTDAIGNCFLMVILMTAGIIYLCNKKPKQIASAPQPRVAQVIAQRAAPQAIVARRRGEKKSTPPPLPRPGEYEV